MQTKAFSQSARVGTARRAGAVRTTSVRRAPVLVRAAAATEPKNDMVDEMGFKLMRKGVKVAAKETILTPRYVNIIFLRVYTYFILLTIASDCWRTPSATLR